MYRPHYICGDEAMKKTTTYSNKLTKIKATAKKIRYGSELKNISVTLKRRGS